MSIRAKKYISKMSLFETLGAIKEIKDFFERELAKQLNLTRVSAPLFVLKSSGLNDNLNGTERPVEFEALNIKEEKVEIVQSLAKWKRKALAKYAFAQGRGLYTDMNAIRRDDDIDATHSIYVDQWDWELVISKEERTKATLEATVKKIFEAFQSLEVQVAKKYPFLDKYLPEDITFIDSEELLNMYPDLGAEERENAICKKHKAVFITGIGHKLKDGTVHSKRAPDYDDWRLNGDILFWSPILGKALEISSMGIRVDENILFEQLRKADCMNRITLPYHKDVLEAKLPYTVGGGIGQSRLCMFFLNKAHIGEVQSSVWSEKELEYCKNNNIELL